MIYVQGFDEVLKVQVCNRASYRMGEVAYGRWADIVVGPCHVTSKGGVLSRAQTNSRPTWRARLRSWRPGNLANFGVDLRGFDAVEADQGCLPPCGGGADRVDASKFGSDGEPTL